MIPREGNIKGHSSLWFPPPKNNKGKSMHTIDCIGLSCPKPLLAVREYLAGGSAATVFAVAVDNDAAKENVARYCGTMGYTVEAAKNGAVWTLTATLTGKAASPEEQQTALNAACPVPGASATKVCVVIARAEFGSGDAALGARLVKTFLATLPEFGDSLWRIVLLNGGVKLCAEGSPVLEELKALKTGGTTILACGTCLEHFGLLDKKVVGDTTNMMDVVTSMQLADKVVTV